MWPQADHRGYAEEARGARKDVHGKIRQEAEGLSRRSAQGRDDRISLTRMNKPLALTLGEPAGIGPDIAIAAWLRRKELKLPAFYLAGDRDFLEQRARGLGLDLELREVRAEDAVAAFSHALPVLSTGHPATAQPGRPDHSSAQAAIG